MYWWPSFTDVKWRIVDSFFHCRQLVKKNIKKVTFVWIKISIFRQNNRSCSRSFTSVSEVFIKAKKITALLQQFFLETFFFSMFTMIIRKENLLLYALNLVFLVVHHAIWYYRIFWKKTETWMYEHILYSVYSWSIRLKEEKLAFE